MPEWAGLETTAAIRNSEKGSTRHLSMVAMTAHAGYLRVAAEGLPRLEREVAELVEELRAFVTVE
jgi:CheY-like chemotaxis protein